jgi:hypothetical protein
VRCAGLGVVASGGGADEVSLGELRERRRARFQGEVLTEATEHRGDNRFELGDGVRRGQRHSADLQWRRWTPAAPEREGDGERQLHSREARSMAALTVEKGKNVVATVIRSGSGEL